MQRIIAYIYRYKGDGGIYRKCGNVGFCRIEETNGRRIINMCFKETYDITRDCEIRELLLEKGENKNTCGCIRGNLIRTDKIYGGQMRLRIQGEKEDGLYIESGQEKYIVLWHGDKEAILLKEKKEELNQNQEEVGIPEKEIGFSTKISVAEDEQLLRAYNRMAKSPMLIEKEMQQVVKLKPQQMVMLPRKYWRLTNNRFLMEGYYVHKHILFLKYKEHYVIGVPSFLWETEEAYANKFGFQSTFEACDYGKPNEPKKYWLTYLN